MQEPDTFNGYILDGFPRTLEQAVWLDGYQAARVWNFDHRGLHPNG